MIRFFDVLFSTIGLIILLPIFVVLLVLGYLDTGSPLFVQVRVGKDKLPFNLYKFRTMYVDTQNLASHLVDKNSITKYGLFLRRTKLDELPQLINVVIGDMSLVGPRPCLYNQTDLIKFREALGIFKFRPGVTGLSQIKDIDMSTPELLAQSDNEMLRNLSLKKYFFYIFKTLSGHGQGDRVG